MPPVPRSTERRFEEVGREHGSFPSIALLHAGIRSSDGQGQSTVQSFIRARTHPTSEDIRLVYTVK